MTVHSLHPSLERSRGFATAPWWEPVYREAFPSFEGMTYVNRDGSGQRDGIDRLIALTSGRTIAIDEKVRERDYPDFCLEYWSVKHKGDRPARQAGLGRQGASLRLHRVRVRALGALLPAAVPRPAACVAASPPRVG
jgi:hypothetical protein